MSNFSKLFDFSSILAVCGTILTVYNYVNFGIILVTLRGLGASLKSSIEFQKETKDREERENLYENIGKIIMPAGNELSSISKKISDKLH